MCIYLPFDDGHASDALRFGEVLGELEAYLYTYDLLAVVGDFNVDFTHTHRRPRTGELLRSMQAACLEVSDLHFLPFNLHMRVIVG